MVSPSASFLLPLLLQALLCTRAHTGAGGASTDGGVFSSGNSFVEEMEISSAVASDFNYDGMLDVYALPRITHAHPLPPVPPLPPSLPPSF